jgi:hypothetical protein
MTHAHSVVTSTVFVREFSPHFGKVPTATNKIKLVYRKVCRKPLIITVGKYLPNYELSQLKCYNVGRSLIFLSICPDEKWHSKIDQQTLGYSTTLLQIHAIQSVAVYELMMMNR